MTERRDYYVYILIDPSKDDTPFYVGKGSGSRPLHHYTERYLRNKSHKSSTILRYRRIGFIDKHKIVYSDFTEAEAFLKECELISMIGRRPNGPLVNKTDGGEGSSGYSVPRTEDWKRKLSEAHRGKSRSEDQKKRIGLSKAGRPLAIKHREKLAAALRGIPKSDEHRAAISAAKTGKRLSPEHAAKWKATLAGRQRGKIYRITTPSGEVIEIKNMKKYCSEIGLSHQHLGQVANGKRNQHKGYRAVLIDHCHEAGSRSARRTHPTYGGEVS